MQNKKGFTLIELMIVVAIIASLAMIAVPMYSRYIERSRNSASQNMLQQIGLAEIAAQTESVANSGGTTGYLFVTTAGNTANVTSLMDFGFRPDPNVGFRVEEPGGGQDGFIAFACHIAKNSRIYVYDNIAGGGVKEHKVGAGITPPTSYGGVTVPTSLFVFLLKKGVSVAEIDSVKTLDVTGGVSTGTLS